MSDVLILPYCKRAIGESRFCIEHQQHAGQHQNIDADYTVKWRFRGEARDMISGGSDTQRPKNTPAKSTAAFLRFTLFQKRNLKTG